MTTGPGATAPGLSLLMPDVLNFQDLVRMNERIQYDEDNDGVTIATLFNNTCEMGLEVRYIEDSMWEFVNPKEAQETLDTIWQKDAKRCGLAA